MKISQAPSAPINGVVPMVATLPRSVPAPYGAVGTVTYSLTLARGAIVPIAALQTNEDQNYVFAIEGGKAVMRYVKIVGQSGTVAAVTGIRDGAQLIMSPPPGCWRAHPCRSRARSASRMPRAAANRRLHNHLPRARERQRLILRAEQRQELNEHASQLRSKSLQ